MVPEHCTSLVQPLDTHINKSFKSSIKRQWSTYMMKNVGKINEKGLIISTMKKARYINTRFVLKALEEVSPELITKSFKQDGFTLKLDGSEESQCRVRAVKI